MPRKTAKLKAKINKNGIHAQRLKEIRRFVDFNYDLRKPLTSSQKRKIKTYHDEISALTNRPYQVYRARSRTHLYEAQEFAQHGKRLPGLKVAFLPVDGANKIKLRFTGRGVVGKTKHVVITDVKLSIAQLLINPEKHVNERIAGNPAKQFTVQAGRYEIPSPYLPSTIGKAVARLVSRYGADSGYDEDNNHYFGRWLHGLKAYEFEAQAGLQEYLIEKAKNIKEGKRARRREFRRKKRLRENT
jgi:hypothetical protein